MADNTLQTKLEADYDYESQLTNHSWLVESAATDGTVEVVSYEYARLLLAKQQNHYLKQLKFLLGRIQTALQNQVKEIKNEQH